jgi:hypothetical protein
MRRLAIRWASAKLSMGFLAMSFLQLLDHTGTGRDPAVIGRCSAVPLGRTGEVVPAILE